MAIASTMGLTIGFDLTNEKFNFTDVNPYGAEGIALADVEGIITVVAPDGTTWHSGVYTAPDIVPSVSLSNNVIDIPTDANGDVQIGNYTITYEITVTGGVQPGTYSKSYTVELCEDTPTLSVNATVDVLCGIITAQDATNYTTADGTWTVNSRTLTLYNANPLASPNSYSTSGSTLTVSNNIYIGTWRYSLEVNVTLTTPSHSCTIDLEIIGEIDVASYDACTIYCCERTLNQRYVAAHNSGDTYNAGIYMQKMIKDSFYRNLIQNAYSCGRSSDISGYLNSLKDALQCSDGCGCNDGDEPTLLVPLCSSSAGTTYTFVAGTGLTVTNIAGTVTYALNANNAAILAAVYNANVSNADGSITVTPTLTPGTPDTYDFDVALSATYKARMVKEIDFVINVGINGGGAPTLTVLSQSIYDTSVFQAPTLTAQGYTTQDSPALIRVSNFMVTPTANYKHVVQVVDATLSAAYPSIFGLTAQQAYDAGYAAGVPLIANVVKKDSGSFDFQLSSLSELFDSFGGVLPAASAYLRWRHINFNFDSFLITVRITL